MKRKPRKTDKVSMPHASSPAEAAAWLRDQARAIERGGLANVRLTLVREWDLP